MKYSKQPQCPDEFLVFISRNLGSIRFGLESGSLEISYDYMTDTAIIMDLASKSVNAVVQFKTFEMHWNPQGGITEKSLGFPLDL